MMILWFTLTVAVIAVGAGVLVLSRAPRHPAHITFAIGLVLVAVESVVAAAGLPEIAGSTSAAWHRARLLVTALIPAPWIAFSHLYARGDYQTTLRRLRTFWLALAVLPAVGALLSWNYLTRESLVVGLSTTPVRLGPAGLAVEILLLLSSVSILSQLERTFRESVGVMRWRIKYLVLGLSALFGFRLFATSQALLYSSPGEVIGRSSAAALLVACVLIAIALGRDRVFTVDLYPSHALVYRSVAVLLTGAYLVVVGVLSEVLAWFGSPGGLPLRAFLILLALAGLAALLLSERMRQRLRQFVSRHLRRPTHDYRQIWRTFTAETSSLVEEGAYCRASLNWISETFQSLSVSVWLVEESGDRLRLGGSTVLPDSTASHIELSGTEVLNIVAALGALKGPLFLEDSEAAWVETLKRIHPAAFPHGGRRLGLPLAAGGRLLGLMTLGDRVGGAPFSTEDLELLKCISDQVAAGLLGLRLSGQLVRAREMEAFQAMSTFFVHDLKNTASTLSLTLQNLQQHFGDPAFREDALRAVRKSVQHLNELIARLGRLRQGLRVEPVPAPLASTIEATLVSVGPRKSVRFEPTSAELPPLAHDSDQIQRVLLNLILNALDATGPDGPVVVRLLREDPWAVVEVVDQGVGMTPEFIRDSLFKPFQTTKSNGLGIGMFHSRMIVEAHHGRILVRSTPGQGTTLRVLLPLNPQP